MVVADGLLVWSFQEAIDLAVGVVVELSALITRELSIPRR
jgi:hypothetical protein